MSYVAVDYRWVSMGSNETARRLLGGLEKWRFCGDGGAIGPKLFTFLDADRFGGSWVGLWSGSRLDPARRFLGPSENLEAAKYSWTYGPQ